nr:putative ribonuclease H-like domain-containing protein [Tanacetum cinerariifolium]
AVTTACYVLNRILVTKPQNKTPYELLTVYPINIVGPSRAFNDGELSYPDPSKYAIPDDPSMPHLEDIYGSPSKGIFTDSFYDDEGVVYKNKKHKRGVVVRNNSRLVTQGHKQKEGIDYDEVITRVARLEAIRIFLAFGSYMGFIVYQMEVKSAFLYGIIEEEVYVSQPPGFIDPKFPNKVYKVMKALYGLHQVPRAWYATLSTFLEKSGYRREAIDKTLFIKHDKKDFMLVQVYVDDIIFGYTNKSWCDEFEELMKNRFQMSSMGEFTFFLGLQVKQKENGIFISQDKYVAEILKKFDFLSVKTTSTPIETRKPLVSVTPKNSHLQAVKRIFRKSITRGCQFLDRRLILWECKKQTIMATSTTETTVKVKTINDEVKIQALIDEKRVNIKESSIRHTLKLDDAEGISCLANAEIFTMALVIICLATNQKFNFSRYILLSLVKNIEAGVPFFMFPLQLLIDHQLGDMSNHKDIYDNPFFTKKVFANMKRVSTGFSGVVTALFDNMLVPAAKDVGLIQDDVHPKSIPTAPSTYKPYKKHKTKKRQPQAPKFPSPEPSPGHRLHIPSNDPLFGGKDIMKLKELMDLCTHLSNKVLELESEVIDIKSTYKEKIKKLEGRVDRLEEENRVLKKLHNVPSKVNTAAPVVKKEKSFKQGRIIACIIEDVEINLEEAQAKLYRIDLEHSEKVLITTARATTTTEATKVRVPRRRRGIVIQDHEETTSTVVMHSKVQSKDIGKELNANINWNDVMEQVKRSERLNDVVMKYQALKRKPLIEAQHYNYNQAFLEEVNEEVILPEKEVEVEAHKREGKSLDKEITKKQKMDEEAEELRSHLQIVPNDDDDDDVYIEATPLALKIPIVDYKIHLKRNKPYFKIIRADGNHMLFLRFGTLLKNFHREYLESLWKLVKERFEKIEPKKYSDDYLLKTLKTMFEQLMLKPVYGEIKRVAGSKDRPPMLAPGNYVQSKSKIKRYIDTKPNHDLIYHCLENPPYQLDWTNIKVPVSEGSPITTTVRICETYKNVLQDIRDQLNAEAEVVQIIITGIDNDIYSTVDACPNACEIWKAIERLKQGESINVQDLETNLYWEFGKFTSQDGETLESYYLRFYKMMNELIRNQCKSQELKTISYHKLYDILKQHQHEVNEIRAEKIACVANPLALVAQQQLVYHSQTHPTHYTQNYSTRLQQAATRNRGKATDKEIDKLMALISLSFKKIYKPTNNNLRTSSNTSRANQDNSPRVNKSDGYKNQKNSNVAGAMETVGSSVVQKSGIQCYNCKEFRHVARECQKPKRAKDAAYHREKMLLCKQEEAGI